MRTLAPPLFTHLACVVVAGATTSASATGDPISYPRFRANLTSFRHASSSTAFLITGNRVSRTVEDGHHLYVMTRAAGGGSASGGTLIVKARHATYVMPATALPYLGRELDPSLFDFATLRTAEHDGRLWVHIGYRGPRPVLPGITITSYGVRGATGYLTPASSSAFGSALASCS
jgi:hypothetical protein